MPQVSVVITTYNRDHKFLKRAIMSVLNQTFSDFELLIVDDNGDKKYQSIVQKVVSDITTEQRIKIIKHEKNMGAQKARNSGIHNSNGEYIAFLDDDDAWLENKLELQLLEFQKSNQSLGLVYCGFNKVVYDNKNIIRKTEKILPSLENEELKKYIYRKNYIGSTSLPLIKKECFNTVGLFDLDLKAKQDYDMWIRISKEYDIAYVDEVLCNYHAHGEDRITNNVKKKIDSEITFLKKHGKEIMKDNVAASARLKQIGIFYYADLNYKKARYFLWKSVLKKLYPLDFKVLALLLLILLKIKPNNYIKRKLKVKL